MVPDSVPVSVPDQLTVVPVSVSDQVTVVPVSVPDQLTVVPVSVPDQVTAVPGLCAGVPPRGEKCQLFGGARRLRRSARDRGNRRLPETPLDETALFWRRQRAQLMTGAGGRPSRVTPCLANWPKLAGRLVSTAHTHSRVCRRASFRSTEHRPGGDKNRAAAARGCRPGMFAAARERIDESDRAFQEAARHRQRGTQPNQWPDAAPLTVNYIFG